MHIELSYQNLPHSDQLTDHVHDTLNTRLARFADRLTRVEVHLGDVNEHKPGPDDKRCLLEARLAGKEPLVVEEHADDPYTAINNAARTLVRALEKRLKTD